jgi:urease accessory protein
MSGLLDLAFDVDASGRTVLVSRRQRFPLRLTVPLYLDEADPGMAFVYVQNPTGGVFPDDRLLVRLAVAPGGRVHLTTPSATKIYRAGDGAGAAQRSELHVGAGAYVELVPEPLIPQAGARYGQELLVTLGEGARFFAAESVAPGRFAREELFEYERLALGSTLRREDGRELCRDAMVLEPARRSPLRRGVLAERPYLGTFLAVGAGDRGRELAAQVDAELRLAGVLAAAGELPAGGGVFARILAATPASLREALARGWALARRALAGSEPPRRRK